MNRGNVKSLFLLGAIFKYSVKQGVVTHPHTSETCKRLKNIHMYNRLHMYMYVSCATTKVVEQTYSYFKYALHYIYLTIFPVNICLFNVNTRNNRTIVFLKVFYIEPTQYVQKNISRKKCSF